MELVLKCAAVGIVSSLIALLLRRYHPELSFLLAAATVTVLLLACSAGLSALRDALDEVADMLQSSNSLLQPLLKCLGISAASRVGAGLCRDSSQAAMAAAVETVATVSAMLIAMPTILTMLRTIGGLL